MQKLPRLYAIADGGAGRGERDQRQVIRNCMTGRGHAVLN